MLAVGHVYYAVVVASRVEDEGRAGWSRSCVASHRRDQCF